MNNTSASTNNNNNNSAKKGGKKAATISLADFQKANQPSSSNTDGCGGPSSSYAAGADCLDWAQDVHNSTTADDEAAEFHRMKQQRIAEITSKQHSASTKSFDFRSGDNNGGTAINRLKDHGSFYTLFFKNLPSSCVDSSVGPQSEQSLSAALAKEVNIVPLRVRILVSGFACTAFVELKSFSDACLVNSIQKLSFGNRWCPILDLTDSQRAGGDNLFALPGKGGGGGTAKSSGASSDIPVGATGASTSDKKAPSAPWRAGGRSNGGGFRLDRDLMGSDQQQQRQQARTVPSAPRDIGASSPVTTHSAGEPSANQNQSAPTAASDAPPQQHNHHHIHRAFIGNLHKDTTAADLHNWFGTAKEGHSMGLTILNVSQIKPSSSSAAAPSTCYAFVDVGDAEQLEFLLTADGKPMAIGDVDDEDEANKEGRRTFSVGLSITRPRMPSGGANNNNTTAAPASTTATMRSSTYNNSNNNNGNNNKRPFGAARPAAVPFFDRCVAPCDGEEEQSGDASAATAPPTSAATAATATVAPTATTQTVKFDTTNVIETSAGHALDDSSDEDDEDDHHDAVSAPRHGRGLSLGGLSFQHPTFTAPSSANRSRAHSSAANSSFASRSRLMGSPSTNRADFCDYSDVVFDDVASSSSSSSNGDENDAYAEGAEESAETVNRPSLPSLPTQRRASSAYNCGGNISSAVATAAPSEYGCDDGLLDAEYGEEAATDSDNRTASNGCTPKTLIVGAGAVGANFCSKNNNINNNNGCPTAVAGDEEEAPTIGSPTSFLFPSVPNNSIVLASASPVSPLLRQLGPTTNGTASGPMPITTTSWSGDAAQGNVLNRPRSPFSDTTASSADDEPFMTADDRQVSRDVFDDNNDEENLRSSNQTTTTTTTTRRIVSGGGTAPSITSTIVIQRRIVDAASNGDGEGEAGKNDDAGDAASSRSAVSPATSSAAAAATPPTPSASHPSPATHPCAYIGNLPFGTTKSEVVDFLEKEVCLTPTDVLVKSQKKQHQQFAFAFVYFSEQRELEYFVKEYNTRPFVGDHGTRPMNIRVSHASSSGGSTASSSQRHSTTTTIRNPPNNGNGKRPAAAGAKKTGEPLSARQSPLPLGGLLLGRRSSSSSSPTDSSSPRAHFDRISSVLVEPNSADTTPTSQDDEEKRRYPAGVNNAAAAAAAVGRGDDAPQHHPHVPVRRSSFGSSPKDGPFAAGRVAREHSKEEGRYSDQHLGYGDAEPDNAEGGAAGGKVIGVGSSTTTAEATSSVVKQQPSQPAAAIFSPSAPVSASCCVYVGNLPHGTTEDELRNYFQTILGVLAPVVKIRSSEDKLKTFGFVNLMSIGDLNDVLAKFPSSAANTAGSAAAPSFSSPPSTPPPPPAAAIAGSSLKTAAAVPSPQSLLFGNRRLVVKQSVNNSR